MGVCKQVFSRLKEKNNHLHGGKNGFHKKNWNLDNLEFLCYNCSYLYAASPIDEKRAEAMEDYVKTKDEEPDWELDEHHIEHLKELGLFDEEKPGEEYISRQ